MHGPVLGRSPNEKCQPLLDESAIVACMASVDLNPIRAGLAKTPETSRFTSVFERIKARTDGQSEDARATEKASSSRTVVPKSSPTEPLKGEPTTTAASQTQRPPDHWLCPIQLAATQAAEAKLAREAKECGRASARGCTSLSEPEYLALLDWKGRQLRRDKRGAFAAELSPLLERLSVYEDSWRKLVNRFRRLFRQAAGQPTSLAQEATRRGQNWLQGARVSHSLFGGTTPTGVLIPSARCIS